MKPPRAMFARTSTWRLIPCTKRSSNHRVRLRCQRRISGIPCAMPAVSPPGSFQWMKSGDDVFQSMLAAIESARRRIRLETYIYAADRLGQQFREALAAAARRGVQISVLCDALGSQSLPGDFWRPLAEAGGEARYFNPILFKRFGFRDHRKMLVCDDEV